MPPSHVHCPSATRWPPPRPRPPLIGCHPSLGWGRGCRVAQAGTLVAEALSVPAVAAPPTRPLQESWRVSDGLCLASPGGESSALIKLESEKQVCEVSAALAAGVGEGGRSCPLRTRPPTLCRPPCGRSWCCADGPSPTPSFTPSWGAWFSCLPPRTLGLSPPSKGHSWGGWTQTPRPPQIAWVRPQGQGGHGLVPGGCSREKWG